MAIFYWWHSELKEVCCDKNIPNDCSDCKNRFVCFTSSRSVIKRPSELEREYFAEFIRDKDIHKFSRI